MSYEFYKLFHYLGIFLVMVALGGAAGHAAGGGDRKKNPQRGMMLAAHGIGLLLMLVAGFGMLARLDVPMGGWFWAKLVLWLLLGASTALPMVKRSATSTCLASTPTSRTATAASRPTTWKRKLKN